MIAVKKAFALTGSAATDRPKGCHHVGFNLAARTDYWERGTERGPVRPPLIGNWILRGLGRVGGCSDRLLAVKPCAVRPPHSPTPVPVLTVSGAAGAKANSCSNEAAYVN